MNDQPYLESPRRARPDELDAILALANEVMRIEQGRQPTIATDYPFIYNRKNVENITVVMQDQATDGELAVSMVGAWMNTVAVGDVRLRAGGINCLATLTGYRGQGLATQVMGAAVEHLAELGCHVGRLTTGINNWYHRLGWENAGTLCTYRFNHSNVGLLPTLPRELEVTHGTEFHDEVISAIVSLHQSDQLGGSRTAEIMRDLLAADSDPNLMGNKRYVIARQAGTPVAYCLDSNHGIIEWGGPPEVIAGLVRTWFGSKVGTRSGQLTPGLQEKVADSPELTLVAPAEGHPFIDLLRSLALPCREDYWGMLYIIDPGGILAAFGLTEIAVSEEAGKFTLTRGSESLSVSRQELAKLLFGPERISDFASDVLPLLFWEWPIEHV